MPQPREDLRLRTGAVAPAHGFTARPAAFGAPSGPARILAALAAAVHAPRHKATMRTLKFVSAGLLALFSAAVPAADPASGTLSVASPELSYAYGPNVISNASGTAELVCQSPVLPCDEYALTIDLPADYAAGHPNSKIEISTAWDIDGDDYDIYLLNAAGAEANSSAGSVNPEVMNILPAAAGVYTVRLVPFLVTGSIATTTIKLIAGSAGGGSSGGGSSSGGSSGGPPPIPATGLAPRYKVHVSPKELANDSGEPTVGYNPLSKRAMFIAYTQANRISFPEYKEVPEPEACDALWEDKSGLITTLNTLDPLMYTDKTTGRTFNSQLSGANSLFEYSDDDGETWTPGQLGPANGGADHQGMITGPYPEGSRPPTATYPNAFYYCSQSIAAAFCARSDDGGQTQGPGFPFKNLDCAAGGLHGHPQVAPDGTLYIPDSSQCIASTGVDGSSGKVIVHRSLDAGMTYTQHVLPESTGGAGSDPSVGIASDGTLYMCYENADGRARVAVSRDRGETWGNDTDIGAAAGLVATRFPAAIAGDPDRAACAFLGTTTEGPSESLAFEGVWHPYVATTYDAGETWHLVNVSPGDPVQGYGGVGPSGTNRNLLDFNDLEVDEMGRTLFAYADGCLGGCLIDPAANSFAAKATLARQTGGRTLFAAFDDRAATQFNSASPLRPAAACAIQSKSLRTELRARLNWYAPDTGGSAVSNYQVFRATAKDGPYTQVGNAGAKTSFVDDSTDASVPSYFYRVVAENAQGAAPVSNVIELPIGVEELINSCALPGQTIAIDGTGDVPVPDLDADYLAIAEPPEFEGNLVITLKMAGFSATQPPPSSFYGILFPTKGNLYIALDSTQGAASFDYGTYAELPQGLLAFTAEGGLDERSSFGADGSIVMVVPKSVFGDIGTGSVIAGFDVRVRVGTSAATSRDTVGPGDYIVRGTAICLANIAPLAVLGATPESGAAPLAVGFSINGSDADAGDRIASYSLDFGDGQSLENQPVSSLPISLSHTYQQAGNYAARLTVTDSRGLVSSNIAARTITVNAPGSGSGSGGSGSGSGSGGSGSSGGGSSDGRFGGALGGLLLLPLVLAGLRRRRHG